MGAKYGKMESAYSAPLDSISMMMEYAVKSILSVKYSTPTLVSVKAVIMGMNKLMVNV